MMYLCIYLTLGSLCMERSRAVGRYVGMALSQKWYATRFNPRKYFPMAC